MDLSNIFDKIGSFNQPSVDHAPTLLILVSYPLDRHIFSSCLAFSKSKNPLYAKLPSNGKFHSFGLNAKGSQADTFHNIVLPF